jgi:hypothetical protein
MKNHSYKSMKKQSWSKEEKEKMRITALEHTGRASKVAIMLPSYSAKCLIKGLKNGKFNRKTFIIAVEKNYRYAKKLENFLKKNFNNYYLHRSPIEILKLDEVLDGKKVDYAFFDFCGNLTNRIAYWLHSNARHFKTNAQVVFTFRAIDRIKQFERFIWKKTDKQVLPEVAEKLRHAEHNLLDIVTDGKLIKNIQFDCQTLHLAFERQEIEFDYVYRYRDSSDMVLIGCTIGEEKINEEVFYNLINSYDQTVGYSSQAIRHGWGHKRRRKGKKTVVKVSYIDEIGISSFADLNKPWVKARITKLSKRDNTTPAKVTGGLKRSLTVRGAK